MSRWSAANYAVEDGCGSGISKGTAWGTQCGFEVSDPSL